jgi:hypothetical protein
MSGHDGGFEATIALRERKRKMSQWKGVFARGGRRRGKTWATVSIRNKIGAVGAVVSGSAGNVRKAPPAFRSRSIVAS